MIHITLQYHNRSTAMHSSTARNPGSVMQQVCPRVPTPPPLAWTTFCCTTCTHPEQKHVPTNLCT
jgi:hypothetical protein